MKEPLLHFRIPFLHFVKFEGLLGNRISTSTEKRQTRLFFNASICIDAVNIPSPDWKRFLSNRLNQRESRAGRLPWHLHHFSNLTGESALPSRLGLGSMEPVKGNAGWGCLMLPMSVVFVPANEQTASSFTLWWRMNLSFLVICSTTCLLGVTLVILQLPVGEDTAQECGFVAA